MIPKSNVLRCYRYELHLFFDFSGTLSRFYTGRIVLLFRLSDMNGSLGLRWVTTVHKLQVLLIAEIGLLVFDVSGFSS
jgi:hypothetical protein